MKMALPYCGRSNEVNYMIKPHPTAQLIYPVAWNGEICGPPFWVWYGNSSDLEVTVMK